MSQSLPETGRLVAIDFGLARIGLAICDLRQSIASPWDVYHRQGAQRDLRYFRELAQAEQVVGWIVGLPVHLSGEDSQMSRRARQFGAWLAQNTGLPVTYVDERFSSAIAEQILQNAQLTREKRKSRRDKIAAQLLLQAYLDCPQAAGKPPGSLDDSAADESHRGG